MAFKSFYSAYSQIVIASVAFLLVVALVCGAAAIGFFSIYPAHEIETLKSGRISMLTSDLSDSSSIEIPITSTSQITNETIINTTQVIANISSFTNTSEINSDTTSHTIDNIYLNTNTTSFTRSDSTIDTSSSFMHLISSTSSDSSQVSPTIVQSTTTETLKPTKNTKFLSFTAPKMTKVLASTLASQNLFYTAFQSNIFSSFKSSFLQNNFLGFCTLTDNTGATYNYITDYYGYVFIFDIDWFYLGYAYDLPAPLFYCLGVNSSKSLYLTSSSGLYQFDKDFKEIKSYEKYDSFWQLYFNSGLIYVTSSADNGIFVFTTSLELYNLIPLLSNQYTNAIAGIGSQIFVGVFDDKTAKNSIFVYVDDVQVDSLIACGDSKNTQMRSIIVDMNGYMVYSCDFYTDTGILSKTQVYFDVLDSAGKYITYKYFKWNAEVFGMNYDTKGRQVTVARNKVSIWA